MPASEFLGRFNLPPADTAAPRLKCNLYVLTGGLSCSQEFCADIREALPQLCWLVVLLRLVASLSAVWRAGGTTEPTIRHCWFLLWLQCTSGDPGPCSRCSRCFLGAPASVTRLRESTGALQADSCAIPDLHDASNADRRVC